jgi:hypothetical protein
MATAAPPQSSRLSGQVLLYVNPEPLDSKVHAKLGMTRSEAPFSFAERQHFVPLQVGEFGPAGSNYPIIFAGDERAPLAVMGVREGENLYINADGSFRVGAYVPGFIRRYPFVVARDEAADRMIVCIDRAFALWTENKPDVLLFENGEPTTFTKNCIEFCGQFDADRLRTEAFVQLLTDLDLLESRQTTFTPRLADGSAGEPQVLAEYFAVSEVKLNALPADKLAELRDNGALAQIYAHINSLFAWDRLINESLVKLAAEQPQAANA